MQAQQLKIGVIDSGVGGLTVLNQLIRHKPDAHYLFIGDNKRAPYGDRPTHAVRTMACQLVDRLVDEGVSAVVIACNTISAHCLNELRARHPSLPLIGTIETSARRIAHEPLAHIGLLATRSTVSSGAFQRRLHADNPSVNISALACPKFVPLIEANRHRTSDMDAAIAETLAPWADHRFDLIILGCTHYPIIADKLRAHLGGAARLFDPAIPMAQALVQLFPDGGRPSSVDVLPRPAIDFYTSGDLEVFRTLAQTILDPTVFNGGHADIGFHAVAFPDIDQ